MSTDHDIVVAIPNNREYKTTRGLSKTITTRSGKIGNTIEEIGHINWQLLTRTTASTQARFDTLYDTIKEIENTCQPLKTAKLRNDEPWMTPRIKEEIAKRQKLYKMANMVAWKKQFNRARHLIKVRKESSRIGGQS